MHEKSGIVFVGYRVEADQVTAGKHVCGVPLSDLIQTEGAARGALDAARMQHPGAYLVEVSRAR